MKIFKTITIFIFILIAVLATIHFVLLQETKKSAEEINEQFTMLVESVQLEETYEKERRKVSIQKNIHGITIFLSYVLCVFVIAIFLRTLFGLNAPKWSKIVFCTPLSFFFVPFFYGAFPNQVIDVLKFFIFLCGTLFIILLIIKKKKACSFVLVCALFMYTPVLIENYIGFTYSNFDYAFSFRIY